MTVFVGHGYSSDELSRFYEDSRHFVSELLAYEPFSSNRSLLRFAAVRKIDDVGCGAWNKDLPRLITCNDSAVTDAVIKAGLPYDKIFVIVNTPNYGGSGGNIGVAYNGDSGPSVFVHEYGHSFGWLLDEYNLYSSDGPIFGSVWKNCYRDNSPPAEEWNDLVSKKDYTLGCNYPNWYRSSATSIMYSVSSRFFNPVSQQLLIQQIDGVRNFQPLAVQFFRATSVRPKRITLRWKPPMERKFDGFRLLRGRKKGGAWDPFELIANLPANQNIFVDTTVSPGREYRYRMLNHNISGQAGSKILKVVTPR